MNKINYKSVPIKRIGKVVTGKTPATAHKEFYDGQYMFISPTELHGGYFVKKSEKTLTEAGLKSVKSNSIDGTSILVGCIGWDMGNVAMCNEKCATNQQINSITEIKEEYNPYYVYYWLCGKKEYLFSIASVTRTPILSKSVFEEVLVPLPEKKQQDNVVNILLRIDKKIALNEQINDNLEQQAKLLYDYWFTQFDFPDENGKPYCSSGGKMVWNEQLKRNIPENWAVVPLSTVFNFKSGFPFSSDLYVTKGRYKLLTIKNVQDNGINLDVDNHINDIPSNVPDYCFLKANDILMSLTGNVGRIGIMYDYGCLLNQRVALAKPVNEDLNSFVYFLLKSDMIRKQYETIANGSSQKNLSPVEAENVLIAYNEQVANHFASFANKYLKTIVSNLSENESLIHLRDWLLPMLMNGQASIAD